VLQIFVLQNPSITIRMHFPIFTIALALVSSTVAIPNYGLAPRQAATLDAAMKARGRSYIGTSLTIRNDNTEQNTIKSEFGSITPENAMKWDSTEPNQNQFNLGGGDQIANWATQNNKQMRCHTLVWYSQLPGWVNNINNNATLISVMENHIKTLMTRWKGKCTHWDVVNEGM
jgi:endo-1,4-beta-xylanase